MTTLLTVIYVFICIFLIFVILLQSGRGGGLGGLGGGTGQQVFGGGGGTNILTRLTSISAALFMLLSVTLAYLSSRDEAALERVEERIQESKAEPAIEGGGGTPSEFAPPFPSLDDEGDLGLDDLSDLEAPGADEAGENDSEAE
jgi:preprotein translocase subunit SecG